MREVLEAAEGGDEGCRTALDVYLHRLRAAVAGMVAAMAGLDVLVFTGGVGENAAAIREGCCRGLEFLGIQIDERANRAVDPDGDVAAEGAAVRVLVVKAREDIAIFHEVAEVRAAGGLDAERAESGGSPPAGG